ncbi:MAG TPA: hypothetical protein VIP30_06475 [Stenotrophomonas sp.]
MKMTNATRLALAAALFVALPAMATSPAIVGEGAQDDAQLAPTRDGGFYISYINPKGSGAIDGLQVKLQRLLPNQQSAWTGDGILAVDSGMNHDDGYGLSVDAGDRAILAYTIQDLDRSQIYVNKFDVQGNPLWGASPGVLLSSDTVRSRGPRAAAVLDGGTVVAWDEFGSASGEHGTNIRLQKVDGNGVPLWGEGVLIASPERTDASMWGYLVTDVQSSEDGGVIVMWRYWWEGLVDNYDHGLLYAQKYDANGGAQWAAPVALWDNDALGLVPEGSFPGFVSDGAGGMVTCWDAHSSHTAPVGNVNYSYVQHVLDDGTEVYPHNGVQVSPQSSNHCQVAYVQQDESVYALISRYDSTFVGSPSSVIGQKFDLTGTPQWGEGVVLSPADTEITDDKTSLTLLAREGGFTASWINGSAAELAATTLQAVGVASDGTLDWPMVTYKTGGAYVADLIGGTSTGGYSLFVWEQGLDIGEANGNLWMQGFQFDGQPTEAVGSARRR